MSGDGEVQVELRPGGIAWVRLDRPRALNALSQRMLVRLAEVAAQLAARPPRVVVVTGEGGRAFAAGADVAAMVGMDRAAAHALSTLGQRAMAAWAALPMPTIAAVGGFALGGGLELALACDIILAADSAQLGLPEVGLGLVPGFGGSHRLARRLGVGPALAWTLGGDAIAAAEAHRLGLVHQLHPAEGLAAAAQALAERLARRSPAAQAAAKRLLMAPTQAATAACDRDEAEAFAALLAAGDGRAGTAAFVAKAPAVFPDLGPEAGASGGRI